MNDLVRMLHGPVIMSIYSSEQIGEIAQNLGAIEDWLRESCEARNAESMADTVRQAVGVLEDLYDDRRELELGRAGEARPSRGVS